MKMNLGIDVELHEDKTIEELEAMVNERNNLSAEALRKSRAIKTTD